jgi:hypothetical protein
MHRLVQAVIGNRMSLEDKAAMFSIALDLVDDCFPKNEPFVAEWETCILLLPHVNRLNTHYHSGNVGLQLPVLLKLGQLLERGAWYFGAPPCENKIMRSRVTGISKNVGNPNRHQRFSSILRRSLSMEKLWSHRIIHYRAAGK